MGLGFICMGTIIIFAILFGAVSGIPDFKLNKGEIQLSEYY